jgi:TolB-like protein/tetratricopeptide (TPR) repeat protein
VIYRFNQFTLDTNRYQLNLSGEPISIEPLVFDLLVYLIENRDRVVTRSELLEKLWVGKVVTDAALAARIKDVRKAVKDSGSKQNVIKTIHGRGYQFIADTFEAVSDSSETTRDQWTFGETLPLPEQPSIAVLPFTNMSGDPEQDYFSDGITEDIITALSRIPRLFVVAKHSTSVYKGKGVDIMQVGCEQGVRFVLEGSVRKSDNKIRITIQLIDASSGNHRLAERYDRELSDIFAVQDEIAKSVTTSIQIELNEGEQARLWAGGTDNLEAWECIVRGNELMIRHSRGDNKEARRLAERALILDSNYANAWVLSGFTHFEDAMWGWSTSREASISTALEAAYKSIEIQEQNPESYMLLAWLKCELAEYDEAIKLARKAVSLSPNHSSNVAFLGAILGRANEPQESYQQTKRALRLCPNFPPWYLHSQGVNCFGLGRDEEAINLFKTCVDCIDPDSSYLLIDRVFLAVCLASAGRDIEAKHVSEEVLSLEPGFQIADWWQFPRKDQTLRNRAVEIWNGIISP